MALLSCFRKFSRFCFSLGILGGMLWLFCGEKIEAAETPPATEYQVKAAFLFNFLKFVEWPEKAFDSKDSPFLFGVLGTDPFGKVLNDAFDGKIVNGRKIIIQRFSYGEDFHRCNLLFISASERRRFPVILDALKNSPVLTVSDSDKFSEAGGIVNFIMQENKIRFEINVDAAKRSDLIIQSTLLNLAKIVREEHS